MLCVEGATTVLRKVQGKPSQFDGGPMRPCGALRTNMDTISCATKCLGPGTLLAHVLHTEPVQELLALYLPASLPTPHTPSCNASRKGLLPARKAEVLRLEENALLRLTVE